MDRSSCRLFVKSSAPRARLASRPRAAGLLLLLACTVLSAAIGCGESRAPAAPSEPPRVQFLTIAGTTWLRAIGEQGKVTVTAHFSDGTTTDVSAESTWSSRDPAVVTPSPGGIISATGLGTTVVDATYRTQRISLEVTVSPGFTAAGRVRAPGSSQGQGGLAGVLVSESVSGQSGLTATNGSFRLINLSGRRLTFVKDEFEPTAVEDVEPNTTDLDVPMQRVFRIQAGETATGTLAPHDVDYTLDDVRCAPCRFIRVVCPADGTLAIRLTWANARFRLGIWVRGQLYPFAQQGPLVVAASLDVPSGETLVYFGSIPANSGLDYVEYRLEASFAPK
jgi:hypothetical protein